jgi:hypothetical protein
VTGGDGVASFTLPVQDVAGATQIAATYAGTATNSPASAAQPFTIQKRGTTLTLDLPPGDLTVGDDSGAFATLRDTSASHNVLPFRSVIFVVSNGVTGLVKQVSTGADGRAALGSVPTLGAGPYDVSAYFAGTFELDPWSSSPSEITLSDPFYLASHDGPDGLSIKANQTISFDAAPTGTVVGAAGKSVTATATSGLPVAYTTNTPLVCSVDGSTGALTLLAVGTCEILADQIGDTSWFPAPQVSQSFSVGATITSVSPSSIGRGAISFPVAIVGTGFAPGTTVSISGIGVTVNSTTVDDSTHLTAYVSVTPGAALTNRDVTVTVGSSSVTCTGCLGVNQGPYGIVTLPLSIGRGAINENVSVIGFNFVSGTWTPASVQFSGAGITVNSVTRVNSVLLTVNLTIDPLAATGARSVTVVNPDGGRSTALAAFTINAAPAITTISPTSRGQGATNQNVVINGSNFGSGGWTSSSVWFSGTGITVNSVTRNSSSKLTVNLSVAPGAATGARDVTLRNSDGGRTTKLNGFTVNPGPTVTSLNPNSRGQGAASQSIVIDGANFSTGTWTTSNVTFSGSGITVNAVTRNSAIKLTVTITVASNATTGARTVTVRNPSDNGTATSAFTVNGRPTISSLSPSSKPRPQTNLDVVITGTGFVNGATVAFSGSGITVVSVTFTDANHITVRINIASSASKSSRNVTVTNPDKGWFTRNGGFTVT